MTNRGPCFLESLQNQIQLQVKDLQQSSSPPSSPTKKMPSSIENFLGIFKLCISRPQTNHFLANPKPRPGLTGKYIGKFRQRERRQGSYQQQASPRVKWIKSLENLGRRFNSSRSGRPTGNGQEYRLSIRSVPEIPMKRRSIGRQSGRSQSLFVLAKNERPVSPRLNRMNNRTLFSIYQRRRRMGEFRSCLNNGPSLQRAEHGNSIGPPTVED